jgi:hypothetical protein
MQKVVPKTFTQSGTLFQVTILANSEDTKERVEGKAHLVKSKTTKFILHKCRKSLQTTLTWSERLERSL